MNANPIPTMTLSIVKRFWGPVQIGNEGCWERPLGRNASGRGRFWIGSKSFTAPRIALATLGEAPPTDKEVLHRKGCDNPACVRPDHLYVDDQSQNMLDASARGTHNMKRKTHCPSGHAYAEFGRPTGNGGRRCLACSRMKWAAARDRGWVRPDRRGKPVLHMRHPAPVPKPCEYCGAMFVKEPASRHWKTRFCSKSCAAGWRVEQNRMKMAEVA